MSLFCLLGYILFLFQLARFIFSTGHLLEVTASDFNSTNHGPTPSSPSSIKRMQRRTRGRSSHFHHHGRRLSIPQHHPSSIPSTTPSNSFESELPNTLPYYKALHLCHFGNAFDHLCSINPTLLSLCGPSSLSPILEPASIFHQHTDFMFTANTPSSTTIDLTTLSQIPDTKLVRFQSAYSTQCGEYPIIFDTGASITITPFRDDFISFDANAGSTRLQGITASAACKGEGTVRFLIIADDGTSRTIETRALYVPDATVRLLSIQTYCKETTNGAEMVISGEVCYFTFPSSIGGGRITNNL